MKITIRFKTPDIDLQIPEYLTERELQKLNDIMDKSMLFREYIDIVFDTEAGTATVEA